MGKVVLTDGSRMDAAAKDADFVVLVFSRDNVEKELVGDAVDRLLSLSDNLDHVRRFKDRVAIVFEGYDTDPRELFEIPECRRFFHALNAHWPFWFHFLEKDGPSISVALRLMCDVAPCVYEGRRRFALRDPKQMQRQMWTWFCNMNQLHEHYGVSAADNEAMTNPIVEACLRGLA